MKTVICIPTVHARLMMAMELQNRFEVCGLESHIILDTAGDLVLNHNRAWRHGLELGAEWVCVAQDDIELCPDFGLQFGKKLQEFIAENIGYVMSLYSNYADDLKAWQTGLPFRKHPGRMFLNEQFLCMRRDVVIAYNGFFHAKDLRAYKTWHDVLLAEFFHAHGLSVFHAIPNLVDHKDVKSTIGHGGRNRHSRTFGLEKI